MRRAFPVAQTLQVRGLRLTVGHRILVDDFNLTLSPEELALVHAPSGAGKTTLLRALAYLDPLADGTITFGGRSPEAWGVPQYRRKVMYLSQRPGWQDTSLLKNLQRPFTYRTANRAYPEAEARELMELLGLDPTLLERTASELSEGEQQRAALIRGLLLRPAVLLLDEPTSALDPDRTLAVEALVRTRVQTGMAAIWVSHDPGQRDRLNGKAIRLS